jgi:hypothetical protein
MSETDAVFVEGRGREKAMALLAIAAELKLPLDVVRTTLNGYMVPADVAKKFDAGTSYVPAKVEAKVDAPSAPKATAETEAEDKPALVAEKSEAEQPAKNASLEAWISYAKTTGYDKKRALTRNELVAEYGQN